MISQFSQKINSTYYSENVGGLPLVNLGASDISKHFVEQYDRPAQQHRLCIAIHSINHRNGCRQQHLIEPFVRVFSTSISRDKELVLHGMQVSQPTSCLVYHLYQPEPSYLPGSLNGVFQFLLTSAYLHCINILTNVLISARSGRKLTLICVTLLSQMGFPISR